MIVVDDTLCPKWGRKIFGTGCFFDHVRRPRPGYIWGHNWVVLAAVVRLFGVPVALPFWVSLYRSEKDCLKGEFRTRLQMVLEVLKHIRPRPIVQGAMDFETSTRWTPTRIGCWTWGGVRQPI